MFAWLLLLSPPYLLEKKTLPAFIDILLGQGIRNTERDYNSMKPRAIPQHPDPPPSTHTLIRKINHAHTHKLRKL